MLDLESTIVAIASASGAAPRGIVRFSGADSHAIAFKTFAPVRREPIPPKPSGLWLAGSLKLPGWFSPVPVDLSLWSAPRSYTGQDMAEIHAPGSQPILDAIVDLGLSSGARRAERGEFTLRAFLRGKLDLTAAEAVHAVVAAESPARLESALKRLAGGISTPVERLRDRVLDLLAHVEANLDFAEEPDVDELGRERLAAAIDREASAIDELIARFHARDRFQSLPKVVLAGPANAGKSRLFNALAGSQASALVSPIPGTTSDTLHAIVDCLGLKIELVDTAGFVEDLFDDADNKIASHEHAPTIARRAALLRDEILAECDLVLICKQSLDTNPWISFPGRSSLLVWTKTDLRDPPSDPPSAIATSASQAIGLDNLKAAIASRLNDDLRESDATDSMSTRCREGLSKASLALRSAAEAVATSFGDELVALDLRLALEELGKVVGAVYTDDILDRVFSRFCIGK